jgi:hypothetical protein
VQTAMSPLEKLESALVDTDGVYVGAQQNAEEYLAALRSDIRAHVCEPFRVSAIVMTPGFPDVPTGGVLTGQCVAFREDYWLVYESEKDRFFCFWGTDKNDLGAHGVYGSPLYCWSA